MSKNSWNCHVIKQLNELITMAWKLLHFRPRQYLDHIFGFFSIRKKCTQLWDRWNVDNRTSLPCPHPITQEQHQEKCQMFIPKILYLHFREEAQTFLDTTARSRIQNKDGHLSTLVVSHTGMKDWRPQMVPDISWFHSWIHKILGREAVQIFVHVFWPNVCTWYHFINLILSWIVI